MEAAIRAQEWEGRSQDSGLTLSPGQLVTLSSAPVTLSALPRVTEAPASCFFAAVANQAGPPRAAVQRSADDWLDAVAKRRQVSEEAVDALFAEWDA